MNGGNGLNQGFSPVLWDAGNRDGLLRLRRRIIYTKCRAPLRVGPAVKIVNMSYESYQIGASFEREESAYIKYIVDHYWDLADWTVFVHGFPEEHNRHLFAWLDSFKRPKPTSPVFIPLNSKYVLYRPILKSFLLRIGLLLPIPRPHIPTPPIPRYTNITILYFVNTESHPVSPKPSSHQPSGRQVV